MADEKANSTGAVKEEAIALASRLQHLSLSAQTIHADDFLNSHAAVAPPMHVSTTFRYSRNPDDLDYMKNTSPDNSYDSHIYSRMSAPNTQRFEAILTSILRGPAVSYSSGLSAFHAMVVFLNPKRIAIGGGYHGCHGVIRLLSKLSGLKQLDLDCADEELGPGDLIHVETPLNPTGEVRDLEFYAAKARRTGALLSVDATFAPPPLLDPFAFGVDVAMHSGTKYFGGHSDLLCGVLAVAPRHADTWIPGLLGERVFLGSVMGSLEGWLGIRSLRTLELRVRRQSADAEALVSWLAAEAAREGSVAHGAIAEIRHASLQTGPGGEALGWLRKQMPNGFGPVFALYMRHEADAKRLPSKLALFHHATSLGGVESLIEWRSMTDANVDKRLLRLSIGIEGWEDLRDDLVQGFEALAKERAAAGS
ncbi:putative cystathionine beta-lyase [Rosellinia necatrix]|uniref:Putative cystathionine beta-lyase n=1 Tax=Rosellinia necatrix TaxID=77044 RepID=A0A1W2TD34_ROSNE|nr:putative cystathionine beta-lyase [Rosellinia necatrix]